MKKLKLNLSKTILVSMILISVTQSCKNDDENPKKKEDKTNYALVTTVKGSNAAAYNYYIQSLKTINDGKTYNNKVATEIVSSAAAGIYQFDKAIFSNIYTPKAIIEKWKPNPKGVFEKQGSVNTTELGNPGNICFKDENIAFVGGNAASKIVVFNPTTMKKTGYIDFTKVTKQGQVTNYPKPGSKTNIVGPSEMLIRGQYLYVAFFLLNKYTPLWIPSSLTADILVIDLNKVSANSTDNSNAIVKWISDDRGVSLGAWNSGFGAKFMMTDERGDIYVQCHNGWGGGRKLTGKPSCILRIKKGETDFDKSYYFDLESASGGLGNSVLNLEYAGNGDFFAVSVNPKAIDPKKPLSYYVDPIHQWYKFNLYNKTAKKVSEQYTRGALVARVFFENGKAYIPYANKKERYVLEVDIKTLDSKRVMEVEGNPMIFKLE